MGISHFAVGERTWKSGENPSTPVHALDRSFHGLSTICPWSGLIFCAIMFWKLCQSFLNWFSSAGCVDNRSFKKLNYNGTSGPFRLSTQCFSTWWYLLAFGFYFLLSSIVSRQKINDMPLGCTHLEPLLQHPSPDRSQDSCLGFFSKDLFPIGFRRTYTDIKNHLWMAFYGHVTYTAFLSLYILWYIM